MNRRDSIKSLITASASLVALPAWAESWSRENVTAHRTTFLPEAQTILASVVDTIIPSGNSIGGLSVGIDQFLQKLFDDCYEKDVQDNIKLQLERLNAAANTEYQKTFMLCDQATREKLLLRYSNSEDAKESDFFKLTKAETIRGFNTSREVMVKYLKYQTAPAHYYGCVDIKA